MIVLKWLIYIQRFSCDIFLTESSDDILAKYRRPTSSPTKPAESGSGQEASANQSKDKEVKVQLEDQVDSLPAYDPNNLESCKAFIDAKKKVRSMHVGNILPHQRTSTLSFSYRLLSFTYTHTHTHTHTQKKKKKKKKKKKDMEIYWKYAVLCGFSLVRNIGTFIWHHCSNMSYTSLQLTQPNKLQ